MHFSFLIRLLWFECQHLGNPVPITFLLCFIKETRLKSTINSNAAARFIYFFLNYNLLFWKRIKNTNWIEIDIKYHFRIIIICVYFYSINAKENTKKIRQGKWKKMILVAKFYIASMLRVYLHTIKSFILLSYCRCY